MKNLASHYLKMIFLNGKIIPTQLSPNSIGATKLDHIKHGYNDHNSRFYQWIDTIDKMPNEFKKIKNFLGLILRQLHVLGRTLETQIHGILILI